MSRLPRVCLADGCPNIAKPGTNRCPAHPARRSPSSEATSTSEWKAVRTRALRRDDHVCRLCGAEATQVDHIVAVAHGGENTLENARSVCADCNLAARPGYTARRPADVAAKLAELRELLASTTSVDARLGLRKKIQRLEEQSRTTAAPSTGRMSGLLAEPEPPTPRKVPESLGWRHVGAISAADVLGLHNETRE